MYDSDRASNGESTSCSSFLSVLHVSDSCLSPAEDSGNSSDDSESEDPPDKKPSPWRGRSEAPPCQEEEEEEEEVKEEEEEMSNVSTATLTANDNAVDMATAGQLPTAAAPPCPSMPQEKADKLLSQSEKEEAEQGEEPVGEAAVSSVHLDEEKKTCPVQERVTKMSPGQEVLLLMSPSRTPPPPSSPQPAPAEEEDSRSTPLSSPRVKGRRANLRESGSETPPRIPLCTAATSPSHMASPPRSVLKRQDEPMVVLHCLPTQRLHPEAVTADSDTDSATEEEEAGSEERSSSALKRKAAEQRAAEKKLRPDRRQEEATPPKTLLAPSKMATGASPKALPSPLLRGESERRSEEVMKAEEWPRPAEETPREVLEERLTGAAMKEPDVHDGTPPPAAEAPGPAPAEELEPQIGPEALVCHEVDLDDLDEKEKPSPEHLLLMMREQQQVPPPLPNLLPSSHLPQLQVRPFLPAAAPSSAPCPEELHPARSAADEERGAVRGEQEGDSSASSSTSLQESRDRGKTHLAAAGSSL